MEIVLYECRSHLFIKLGRDIQAVERDSLPLTEILGPGYDLGAGALYSVPHHMVGAHYGVPVLPEVFQCHGGVHSTAHSKGYNLFHADSIQFFKLIVKWKYE